MLSAELAEFTALGYTARAIMAGSTLDNIVEEVWVSDKIYRLYRVNTNSTNFLEGYLPLTHTAGCLDSCGRSSDTDCCSDPSGGMQLLLVQVNFECVCVWSGGEGGREGGRGRDECPCT